MRLSKFLPLLVFFLPQAVAETPPTARLDEKQRAFLKDYCLACHHLDSNESRLSLDSLSLVINTIETADVWQKILNQVNSGDMPPEKASQPIPSRKGNFLEAVARALVSARKSLSDPGRQGTMRRLNQREYKNSIRKLLGVEANTRDLPSDEGTGGFDTVGASMFLSGDQIEQYLRIGREAIDAHIALHDAEPQHFIKREEAEVFGNRRMDGLFRRTRELHEQYILWTAAVDQAAQRSENRAIAAEIREKAKKPRPSSGVPYPSPLFFYYDWDRLTGAPPPNDFGFQDAQQAFAAENQYLHYFPYYDDYQKLPARDQGAWLLFYQAYRETYVEADDPWPDGEYILRMRVAANEAVDSQRHFVEIGQRGDDVSDFTVLSASQVTGSLAHPQIIETKVRLNRGGNREFAVREKRPNSRRAEIRSYHDEFEKSGHGPKPAIWIDWLELDGPLPVARDPHTVRIALDDGAQARPLIESFATRAFRGVAPDAEYLDKLMGLFDQQLAAGHSPQDALKEPLSVVLASPAFLFLHEPVDEGTRRPLNGFELATRLSYFLWSAPPDEELLELARTDQLSNPSVLTTQVDRLLDQVDSRNFIEGFFRQYLGLERLDFFQFDFRLHRGFDDSTKAAAREEVFQTISHLLRDNQSLRRLLKSDFVVVNGLLANYYGIEGVTGDVFRKQAVPLDSPRGGLLGMAAILAMGSNGQVTSPVERGAWVLRKVLHDPPPPAPPNVPQLARLDGKFHDVREQLRLHQEEPQCSHCHRRIDPLGLGLENFDAAGLWRTSDFLTRKDGSQKRWPIDPSGALYQGPSFANFFELREILASRSDAFARGFTEALIEYALGRPFSYQDGELADEVMHRVRNKDYAIREFIHAIVASDAFRSK